MNLSKQRLLHVERWTVSGCPMVSERNVGGHTYIELCGKRLPFLARGNLISDRWVNGVMITVSYIVQPRLYIAFHFLFFHNNRMTRELAIIL
jgi:hypothetical protein